MKGVWISPTWGNSLIIKKLTDNPRVTRGAFRCPEVERTPEWEKEEEQLINRNRRYQRGEQLRDDEIPKCFYGTYLTTRINSLPDFFLGGGVYICVSERCADVFRQFDLGQGALHPVEMWQGNGKSRITEEPFFVLTFGCHKRAFLPELSNPKRFKKFSPEGDFWWRADILVGDDDTALAPAALEGPDLWLDPTVRYAFFMSAELEKALKAAKVARNIRRSRCRVIEG